MNVKNAVLLACAIGAGAIAWYASGRHRSDPGSYAPQKANAVLTARVTRVIDGDTIDATLTSGPVRVRLHGIDAPEKTQPHGKEATAALTKLVLNRPVEIEPFEQDRYERLVGIIYVDETNVNAALVRDGQAWAFRRYMRKADSQLCTLEAQARLAKRGLWAAPMNEIEAPWEWRNKRLEYVTDYGDETDTDCIAAIGR